MVEISDFYFGYDYKQPFEKRIFSNVNLKIEGSKVLLVGKSGSGKSTFFKSLIRYLKPSSGSLTVTDEVGYVLQNVNGQIITNSIYDEINLGYKNKFNTNISESVIYDYFKIFNVNFSLGTNPRRLSGGQKKIVILISILVTNPKLLLLDEPFVGLDYKRRLSLIKYLASYENDFILSTHDVNDSIDLFDQVILINSTSIEDVSLESVFEQGILKRPVSR